MQIDDETLMAFADGELDPAMTARVAAAIDADAALQARLRLFSESRTRLQAETRESPGQNPARDSELIARIRAASVAPANTPADNSATAHALPRPGNINRRPLATIAAALALVVIGGGLWWQLNGSGSAGLAPAQLAALNNLPSGEEQALDGGTSLTMIASYRNDEGEFCREFETTGAADVKIVVACRGDQDDWSQRFAMDIPVDEGYLPASGELAELDAFLADMQAGAPLTPEEEAMALAE